MCLTSLTMLGQPLNHTMTLHNISLFLCVIVTLHMPNCIIIVLLHVCSMTPLSLFYCILNISRYVKVPSLAVSSLYMIFTLFCLLLVSNFILMLDQMLLKLRDVYIYHTYLSVTFISWVLSAVNIIFCISCLGSASLHLGSAWFSSLPTYILSLCSFPQMLHIFLYIRHCAGW